MKQFLLKKGGQYLLVFLLFFMAFVPAYAQEVKVQGRINDENGSAMPGVTVLVKGTTKGAASDPDGNYTINANESDILVFSFIGYEPKEMKVGAKTNINVSMTPNISHLDEVVVVGYGTIRKSDLTGSVATVGEEELNAKPTVSIENALQGRVSGVRIQTTSAAPGGGSSIVIRGGNSINSGIEPLYVVDGFPMSPADANLIAPQDIKSIEVLKDGSSTAIYGSRGANGVVLISTKRGDGEKTKILYSHFTRFEKPYNTYDLVNAGEMAMLYDEAQVNKGVDPTFTGDNPLYPVPSELGNGVDWFNELTRNGLAHNHQLSISGGSEKTAYRFSGSYYTHQGVMLDDDFSRGSLSTTIDTKVNSWIRAGLSLIAYKDASNRTSSVSYLYKMFPFIPKYDDAGEYNFNYFADNQMNDESPLNYVNDRLNRTTSDRATGNLYLQIEPLKGLTIKSTLGGYVNNIERNNYLPKTTIAGSRVGGDASINERTVNSLLNENIITYAKDINKNHRFTAMGAFTKQYQITQTNAMSGTGFASDYYGINNMEAAENPGIPASQKNKWQLASYLGRINYVFNDKYLLTVTGRADGSSKFGKDNRWAFFPSVALGWRLSQEEFIQNIDAISFLKLRASYGETGNSDIGLYQSRGVLHTSNYIYGETRVTGVAAGRVANPDLRWETTTQYDVGVDVGLFNDRVTFTTDLYYKETTDLLLDVNINATSGYTNALKNVGALQNKGAEFSLNAILVDREVRLDLIGNISFNRNKITKLNEGGSILLAGGGDKAVQIILEEGQPVGQFSGDAIGGVFNNDEEIADHVNAEGDLLQPGAQPGDIKFSDANGDGIISGDDWEVLGNSNPDFIYSFGTSASYKNFSVDVFFTGVYGNEIFNVNKFFMTQTDNPRVTLHKDVLDRWTPDNPDGTYPRMGSTDMLYAVESGSFFKLSNIRFNYNIPEVAKVVKHLNIYFSMQNVFTITDYTGFDPDINTQGRSSVNFGTDANGYPNPRTFTVGVNLSL